MAERGPVDPAGAASSGTGGSGCPAGPASDRPLPADLAARVEDLLRPGLDGRPTRRLLGLTGPPGAGKSTLAAAVVAAFPGRCAVVPMDGFHLAHSVLVALGRADRKGAPDTFDAAGYVALLTRLHAARETVYAPEYRRDLHNAVAGAVPVPPEVPLVVTEGNYLLLDRDGFAPVRGLLDACWYVEPAEAARVDRLVARHVATGKAPDAARAWTLGPDQANTELVSGTRALADLVVDPG